MGFGFILSFILATLSFLTVHWLVVSILVFFNSLPSSGTHFEYPVFGVMFESGDDNSTHLPAVSCGIISNSSLYKSVYFFISASGTSCFLINLIKAGRDFLNETTPTLSLDSRAKSCRAAVLSHLRIGILDINRAIHFPYVSGDMFFVSTASFLACSVSNLCASAISPYSFNSPKI